MISGDGHNSPGHDVPQDVEPLFEAVRHALGTASETQRYRTLAALFVDLANCRSAVAGPDGGTEPVDALSRKVHLLAEEAAGLRDQRDALATDVEHRTRQLEAEQTRAHQLDQLNRELQGRLQTTQREFADLEAKLTQRANELHEVQRKNEELALQLQRLERQQNNGSDVGRLLSEKQKLAQQVEVLGRELAEAHTQKQKEVGELQKRLERTKAPPAKPDVSVADVWPRLAQAKVVDGGVAPTRQSAERLVDLLVVTAGCLDDFDRLLRPFLSKYTKSNQQVKVPWDVYAKGQTVPEMVRAVLQPAGGRPVAVAKLRLRALYAWTEAAMIACDAAIESVGAELHTFLISPAGLGTDPNRTLRQFLRDDGHELFLQRLRQLRDARLGEAFGKVG